MKLLKRFSEVILFMFLSTILVQSVFYFIGINLTIFSFVISMGLWLLFSWYFNNKKIEKESIIALAFFLCLVGACALYFSNFVETTYDGAFYHGAAMTEMLNGWNPMLDLRNHVSDNVTFWVDYYPKATWIFSGILIQIFKTLSAGMMINLLIAISTFLYAIPFVKKRSNSNLLAILIGVVILLNPITIEQLHTYYVDAILGNLVTLLLMLGMDIIDEYSVRTNVMIFVVSVILINIKFTGLGFAGIINLFIWLYFIIKKQKEAIIKYTLFGIAMLVIGLGIIGYNPYMINILSGRHIFYPIAGKDAIDVIEFLIPENLMGKNPIYKFQYSILGGQTILESLKNFNLPGYLLFDQQIGAFGTYFSKMLLLSSGGYALYLLNSIKNKKVNLRDILLFLGLVFSILANIKNIWWVRYAPQMWLFIPIGMAMLWKSQKLKVCVGVIVAMVVYQNVNIFINTAEVDYEKSLSIKRYYEEYKGQDITITIHKFVESWDTIDLYWFDSYEVMRSKQFGVNIREVVHEVDEKNLGECYHMHAYKLCLVKETSEE